MYATWKTYLRITNNVTAFTDLIGNDATLGVWVLMSSPADHSRKNLASIYHIKTGNLNIVGDVQNYGGFTDHAYTARGFFS